MPQHRHRRIRASFEGVALVCLAIVACESLTEVVAQETYVATLNGSAVEPDSVATGGSGSFDALLTSDTNVMTYQLSYANLSSVATEAHIHGPARDTVATSEIIVDFAALPPGSNGTLTLGTSGSAEGSVDLSGQVTPSVSGDSLRHLLKLGLLYVDVHSVDHPAGEIRGQVAGPVH
jgi:hypothetical protein